MFRPQQNAWPMVDSAQVCEPPAAMARNNPPPATGVGTARTIAEVWAGASLGRYARAEYARIVVAGVVFLLTLVLVGLAAATSSPTRRMIYAAVADLVAGLGFIVLGLILRSAKARAATR